MTITQPPPSIKSPVSVWTSGAERLIQGEDGRTWHGINGAKFLPECSLTAFGWPVKAQGLDASHQIQIDATGGTFDILFADAALTALAVPFDHPVATLQTDLDTLLGAGEITVSGSPGLYILTPTLDGGHYGLSGDISTDGMSLTGGASTAIVRSRPMRKAQQSTCSEVYFSSIGIYVDNICREGGHPAITDFQNRSAAALARNWQYVLSEELMDGTWSELAGDLTNLSQLVNSAAPFVSNKRNGSTLRAAATDLGGAAVTLAEAIPLLMREWRDFTIDPVTPDPHTGMRNASMPVLHIPDWALSYLPDGPTLHKGGTITTNYGTMFVAPGAGYSGAAPGTAAPAQLGAGNFYPYLSGVVGYDVSGIPDLDNAASFHERINTEVNLQEVNALAMFDPTTVLTIEVQE